MGTIILYKWALALIKLILYYNFFKISFARALIPGVDVLKEILIVSASSCFSSGNLSAIFAATVMAKHLTATVSFGSLI
ncbi:MAG: hypothetical protein UZ05_CHB002001592 [Chlorobi bacterium OLB5]|nr:MAG: hypothetical protein UZ05_CHB002001592 [Chlorobi bacterium OLB5]